MVIFNYLNKTCAKSYSFYRCILKFQGVDIFVFVGIGAELMYLCFEVSW